MIIQDFLIFSKLNFFFFFKIDKDGNGYFELSKLKDALDIVGFKKPQWEVRLMIEEIEKKKKNETKGRVTFQEFQALCCDLKSKEIASTFKDAVTRRENLETLGGMSSASSVGTTHSVRVEEQVAFSDWINRFVKLFKIMIVTIISSIVFSFFSNLSRDPDLAHLLPINFEGRELYEKVEDGILLW